jgi:hypothetical protein
MADKTPIRGAYNGSSALTGLAEYASGDTVSVAFGGTGATSLTDNAVLIGNSTSAIQPTSALTTNGQIVIGGTSGPAVANISGTTNEVDITNGDGTIAIGLPSTVSGLTCVGATCLGGTLQTAAQANVTSIGTLTSLNVSGDVSLDGGSFVFNESGADKDFRIEGDTAANLFITDASTDRIGIGTATPSHLLDVEGVVNVATCIVTPKVCITSQYALPAADGSAGQLMCTDGSGALAFASAVAPSGVDDIKGYINGGALKWEVASGTTWSFGWWQSSNGQWWLLGNTAEVDTFTRAQAEFYIPTGDINDVPSS